MPRKRKRKKVKIPEKPWLKIWPEDIPQSIQYPNIPLFEFLDRTSEIYGNYTAIVYLGREITYKELKTFSNRFAAGLRKLGVRKGDVVALFLPNIPQFVIAYYGALKVGATITAVNPLYKEREVEYQLSNSEAETIVCLDLLYPIVKKVWRKQS